MLKAKATRRRLLVLALLPALLGLPADAAAQPDAAECRRVKAQIERLHQRMRAGYRAKSGNRMAARLLKLKKKRAKVCR